MTIEVNAKTVTCFIIGIIIGQIITEVVRWRLRRQERRDAGKLRFK